MRSVLEKVLFEKDVGKQGGTVRDVLGKYRVNRGGRRGRGRSEEKIGSAGEEM